MDTRRFFPPRIHASSKEGSPYVNLSSAGQLSRSITELSERSRRHHGWLWLGTRSYGRVDVPRPRSSIGRPLDRVCCRVLIRASTRVSLKPRVVRLCLCVVTAWCCLCCTAVVTAVFCLCVLLRQLCSRLRLLAARVTWGLRRGQVGCMLSLPKHLHSRLNISCFAKKYFRTSFVWVKNEETPPSREMKTKTRLFLVFAPVNQSPNFLVLSLTWAPTRKQIKNQ